MVKENRRRPSSANPTARPRKVAGRDAQPAPPADEVEAVDAPAGQPDPAPEQAPEELVVPGPASQPTLEPEPDPAPEPPSSPVGSDGAEVGFVGSPTTTRILLGVIAVLAVLALAGAIFLWVDDDEPAAAPSEPESSIAADEDSPVRITGSDAQVAVAAAAQAAYTIVATSYEDYDEQVDEAAALMTPTFADDYRETAEDVADSLIAAKTEVQVSVVAQGVVRADQEQVQALVFLNMFTTKDGKEPVFTPYRVLVTVVNTDQGWLVSDLETS